MTHSLQGNYSDLLVVLSDVYSQLRGDARPKTQQEEEEEAAMLGSTVRGFWILGGTGMVLHGGAAW